MLCTWNFREKFLGEKSCLVDLWSAFPEQRFVFLLPLLRISMHIFWIFFLDNATYSYLHERQGANDFLPKISVMGWPWAFLIVVAKWSRIENLYQRNPTINKSSYPGEQFILDNVSRISFREYETHVRNSKSVVRCSIKYFVPLMWQKER